MKPEIKQAYEVISTVTGLYKGTREEHVRIQNALKLIEQELTPKPQD